MLQLGRDNINNRVIGLLDPVEVAGLAEATHGRR